MTSEINTRAQLTSSISDFNLDSESELDLKILSDNTLMEMDIDITKPLSKYIQKLQKYVDELCSRYDGGDDPLFKGRACTMVAMQVISDEDLSEEDVNIFTTIILKDYMIDMLDSLIEMTKNLEPNDHGDFNILIIPILSSFEQIMDMIKNKYPAIYETECKAAWDAIQTKIEHRQQLEDEVRAKHAQQPV